MLHKLIKIKEITDLNIETLNNHESVECSDEFSAIRIEPALDQMNLSNDTLSKALAMMGIVIAIITCEMVLFCGCVIADHPGFRRCQNTDTGRDFASFLISYKHFN